ncbi:MAG: hypothetical protein CM15mP77_2980 [Synechococcus sp.]|nr:MAG: hypothetical protein CM15mP77_2980 [Synechococcus sp.]
MQPSRAQGRQSREGFGEGPKDSGELAQGLGLIDKPGGTGNGSALNPGRPEPHPPHALAEKGNFMETAKLEME